MRLELKMGMAVFCGIMATVSLGYAAKAASFSWDGNGQTMIVAQLDNSVVPPSASQVEVKPMKAVSAKPKGKVLVIFSSENKITLKNNIVHPTGFFLSELIVPLQRVLDAGYEPVFANPKGSKAVMDKISDGAFWFGDAPNATPEAKTKAQQKFGEVKALCKQLGICGDDLEGTKNLKSLAEVISEGLDQYDGIFVPGGHAPMEDLWKDRDLGTILRHFHNARKPTALICHGPIALLSAMAHPEQYISALEKKDAAAIAGQSKDWIYRGYSLISFTTAEEQQEEPGQDNALGGFVRFYPDEALEAAGANIRRADKWNSNVIQEKELITGQNPMSDEALASAFVKALNAQADRR